MADQFKTLNQLNAALADKYRIERELGQGGMAIVYHAEDVKHERQIAIKVLRPELGAVLGPERFLSEIKLTARLNHPNILPLLDSGDARGLLYYIMPYVEGETLRQKLNRETQLSVDDALRYAQHVAAALQYAHAQGVMHRDIKPENILLHADVAMVADFGIALALDAAGGDRLTETGLSIGTPEYMSPEQASGARQLDARSDVYALGCVVHEMLTGDPPFTAQTPQAIIARQVLDPPPSIRTVRPSVSAEVEEVVHRALAKTPVDRWQTAEEFEARLKAAMITTADISPLVDAPKRTTPKPAIGSRQIAIGITGAIVVGIAALWVTMPSGTVTMTPIAVPTQVTLTGRSTRAAISPDGAYLAYNERTEQGERIVVQDVEGGGSGLELGLYDRVASLHWSPNGSDLLVGGVTGIGVPPFEVAIFSRFGGEPRRLPRGGALAKWSADGQRIVVWWEDIPELGLIDPSTGDSVGLPLPEPWGFTSGLDWSPDGRWFAILMTSPGRYHLWTVATDGRDAHEVVSDTVALAGPLWIPDGRGVYYLRSNGGTADLVAIEISTNGQAVREAVRIMSGVPALDAAGEFINNGWPTMSSDGSRLLFTRDNSRANLWTVSTAVDDRPPAQQTRGTAAKSFPRLSPNGDAVAYLEAARGQMDVWVDSLNGADAHRITFDGTRKYQLTWSPGGTRLAYGVRRSGNVILNTVDMDGVVHEYPETKIGYELRWPEEEVVIHDTPEYDQLLRFNLTDRSSLPLTQRGGFQHSPRVSPDGQRIALFWNGVQVLERDGRPRSRVEVRRPRSELDPELNRYSPIGWDAAGRHIVAMSLFFPGTKIYAINESDGFTRTIAELPYAATYQQVDFHANTETVVAALTEEQVDIWMIEDFDPR